MAGPDDDFRNSPSTKRQSVEDHDRQPPRSDGISTPGFAAFKHFIDDSVSTISSHFIKLPSNIASIRSNMEHSHHLAREIERDISARWMGSSDSPEDIQKHVSQLSVQEQEDCAEKARSALEEAAISALPLQRIVALYKDPESGMGLLDSLATPLLALGGTWMYLPETGDTLPTASNWSLMGDASPRWLSVDWFKRDPYSPIRLEAHPDLSKDGSKWRDAFEDLMHAALDKPMSPVRDGRWQSVCGLDWMLSLQFRGVLPPLLPRFYADVHARHQLQHNSIFDVIRGCKSSWRGIERPWADSLTQDFAELRDAVAVSETVEALRNMASPCTELDMYERNFSNPALEAYRKQLDELELLNRPRLLAARRELSGEGEKESHATSRENVGQHSPAKSDWKKLAELEQSDDNVSSTAEAVWDEHKAEVVRLMGGLVALGRGASGGGNGEEDESGRDDLDDDDEAEEEDDYCPIANSYRRRALQAYERSLVVDEAKRRELYRRLTNVLDEDAEWTKFALMETDDLEAAVETLEEEHENLRRMVNGAKAEKSKKEVEKMKKPDILSALTTTQTTRLPDGTVTTKVVLKKRFGDGREEVSESVHTYHEGDYADRRVMGTEESEEKNSGKGWFWR